MWTWNQEANCYLHRQDITWAFSICPLWPSLCLNFHLVYWDIILSFALSNQNLFAKLITSSQNNITNLEVFYHLLRHNACRRSWWQDFPNKWWLQIGHEHEEYLFSHSLSTIFLSLPYEALWLTHRLTIHINLINIKKCQHALPNLLFINMSIIIMII